VITGTAVKMSVGLCDHKNCQIQGRYRQHGKQNSWLYRNNYCDIPRVPITEDSEHVEIERVDGGDTGNNGTGEVRIVVTANILSEDEEDVVKALVNENVVNKCTEKVIQVITSFQTNEKKIPDLFNDNGADEKSIGSKVRRHKTLNVFYQHHGQGREREQCEKKSLEVSEDNKTGLRIVPPYLSQSAVELGQVSGTRMTAPDTLLTQEDRGGRRRVRDRIMEFLKLPKTVLDKLKKWKIFQSSKIFGSTIGAIANRDGTEVPIFLSSIIRQISLHLHTPGLYRQNGNLATIQSLRMMVDDGQLDCIEAVKNIHILTGLLKLFFRELQEPLIPWTILLQMVAVMEQNKDKDDMINNMASIIYDMPRHSSSSLFEVLDHLSAVACLNNVNSMNAENLAIVLGPTLTWSQEKIKRDNISVLMFKQNSVIEFLITNCRDIKKIKEKT